MRTPGEVVSLEHTCRDHGGIYESREAFERKQLGFACYLTRTLVVWSTGVRSSCAASRSLLRVLETVVPVQGDLILTAESRGAVIFRCGLDGFPGQIDPHLRVSPVDLLNPGRCNQ